MKTALLLGFLFASPSFLSADAPSVSSLDDAEWFKKRGTLLFHDAFEREETGNGLKDLGNGWESATADRVPQKKQADLDEGILKVTSAPEAKHAAHIHHDAGFEDGGVRIRFKLPGLSDQEDLTVGFVDRECKAVHAGHLCYAIIRGRPGSITLTDRKTGSMDLINRSRAQESMAKTGKIPPDLAELYKTKEASFSWSADHEWHELVLVTEGNEMRVTLDGKRLGSHRSEGFAHPVKRWLGMLMGTTAWVDDVEIWKVK